MGVKIFIITLLCVYNIYCQIETSEQEDLAETSPYKEISNFENFGSELEENDNDLMKKDLNDKVEEDNPEEETLNAEEIKDDREDEDKKHTVEEGGPEQEELLNAEEPKDDRKDDDKKDKIEEGNPEEDVQLNAEDRKDDEEYDYKDFDIFKLEKSQENAFESYKEDLEKEYEKEKEAASASYYFGTNQHYQEPVNFDDFGRRFVLSYPYIEKNKTIDPAESKLDSDVKEQLEIKKRYLNHLTPVKAPPEFVLSIAKQSAILEAAKPVNPSANVITKDILRTGNFWNDVWKEDVDKKTLLRTSSKKSDRLERVTVEIEPGSKLYELVSVLRKRSPVLLYVINKSNAN